ncbi:hypothetical protein C5167_027175 [Papaver somniferum]|nr:hypothetical protein C5167_027175 [Papaver somniferum]
MGTLDVEFAVENSTLGMSGLSGIPPPRWQPGRSLRQRWLVTRTTLPVETTMRRSLELSGKPTAWSYEHNVVYIVVLVYIYLMGWVVFSGC